MKPKKTLLSKFRLLVSPETGELVSRPLTSSEAMMLKSKVRREFRTTTKAGILKTFQRHGILSEEFIAKLLKQPHPKKRR